MQNCTVLKYVIIIIGVVSFCQKVVNGKQSNYCLHVDIGRVPTDMESLRSWGSLSVVRKRDISFYYHRHYCKILCNDELTTSKHLSLHQ